MAAAAALGLVLAVGLFVLAIGASGRNVAQRTPVRLAGETGTQAAHRDSVRSQPHPSAPSNARLVEAPTAEAQKRESGAVRTSSTLANSATEAAEKQPADSDSAPVATSADEPQYDGPREPKSHADDAGPVRQNAPRTETAARAAPSFDPSAAFPEPIVAAEVSVRRPARVHSTEAELGRQLRRMATDIVLERGTLLAASRASSTDGTLQALVARQEQLHGLPFRWGNDCKTPRDKATVLAQLSTEFRGRRDSLVHVLALARAVSTEPAIARRNEFVKPFETRPWTTPEAVPALEQMLQVEPLPVRLLMVEILGRIEGPEAAAALARRAMYDLSGEVRVAAREELRPRPFEDYLALLVDGFRHPWQQVAWNAADTLVELDAEQALPKLVDLLDAPHPSDPFVNEKGKWVVRELVSINHLANCQLCHSSSSSSSDPVRGVVPLPGQPLPSSPSKYYARQFGQFVRADVTYLKQDFSVMQTLTDRGLPKVQRFDYFVRERELKPLEVPGAPPSSPEPPSYPQREAALFALRGITGQDVGDSTNAWRKVAALPQLYSELSLND